MRATPLEIAKRTAAALLVDAAAKRREDAKATPGTDISRLNYAVAECLLRMAKRLR